MTSRYTGTLDEGTRVLCDNCQDCQTIQFDGTLPNGWFSVMDSMGQKVLFCSSDCIIKKLNAKEVKFGAVEKKDFFFRSMKSGRL